MVIVEEGTNFPRALGRKNIPPAKTWGDRPIANLPSVIAGGMDRSFLPQLLERFRIREKITRRERRLGTGLSVHTEQEVAVHNAQMTKYPIVPLLDRPHPLLDAIKAQSPLIPRVKLLGVFGVIDPEEVRVTEKNIPRPFPRPYEWPEESILGRLPSAISILEGPQRTVHPRQGLSVEL